MEQNQIVAVVDFSPEIFTTKNPLRVGIIKASKDTGILVWLDDENPTQYGHVVYVRKDIGNGNYMSFRAVTVGNLYGYCYQTGTAYDEAYKKWITELVRLDDLGLDPKSEEYIKKDKWISEGLSKANNEAANLWIAPPVIKVCNELGVKKLLRHGGSFPRALEGVEVEYLSGHRETVYVDI